MHAVSEPPSQLTPAAEFEALYREYFAFVWRCLRALGVRDNSLDDACQEVFLIVHRRLTDYRGDASPRAWVYGILRRVASNHRRSLRRRRESEPLDQEAASDERGPLAQVLMQEDADFLETFLSRLSEANRELFALALVEQLTIPEVAEMLGIPLNTAYTRLRKVRIEFQRALARRNQR